MTNNRLVLDVVHYTRFMRAYHEIAKLPADRFTKHVRHSSSSGNQYILTGARLLVPSGIQMSVSRRQGHEKRRP